MKRIILAIFMFVLLSGCATFPAARIDGNVYTDDEHSIIITIPDGWEASQTLPKWLLQNMPYGSSRLPGLYMFSKNYRGSMFFLAEKIGPISGSKPVSSMGPDMNGFAKRYGFEKMFESLKKEIPLEVKLKDWEAYADFMVIHGTVSYDALDYYVGIRSNFYDCRDSICAYALVNMSLIEKKEQNEKLLKDLDIITK